MHPITTARLSYQRKVLLVSPVPPIAYWPLSGQVGTSVALDVTGNGRHGAYTAVALGQAGKGDGGSAALLNGSTSYIDVFSTGLQSAFNGAEGSFAIWLRLPLASNWTDGSGMRAMTFVIDANNLFYIRKDTTNNQLASAYSAGGTAVSVVSTAVGGRTAWFHAAITWSKSADQFRFFLNGVQVGTTQTGLGTFAGSLATNTTLLGALSKTPTVPWNGLLQDAAIWPVALPPAAIAELYTTGLSGL